MTSAPNDQNTAGVPFPPPLAFLVGLGLGFALQYVVPLQILPTSAGAVVLASFGVVLALAALALAIAAFVSLRLARTSPFPERPTTSLVVRGPFRITRNPLYVAMALLHAGIALYFNALWSLLFLAPALIGIRFLVIAREERYLLLRFGTAYESYCRSVRRWL